MIHFHGTAEERLAQTLFIVEGKACPLWCQHSKDSLFPPWNMRENKRAYPASNWDQVASNPIITVGHIGKRPINISTEWYRIDGQWVMFYEGCSELVDRAMIEKWLDEHFTGTWDKGTRRAAMDEDNFSWCLQAIDEANAPGYVKPGPLLTAAQVDKGFVGKRFTVVKCHGKDHVRGDPGCVCRLIGKKVTIRKRYETPFAGTASYHLKGHKQRVQRSEVGLPDVKA